MFLSDRRQIRLLTQLKVAAFACLMAIPLVLMAVQDNSSTLDFDTPDFIFKLTKASQTIAALEPKGANGFDFTPADRLADRSEDHFNALGDIDFRLRQDGFGNWQDFSTSACCPTPQPGEAPA